MDIDGWCLATGSGGVAVVGREEEDELGGVGKLGCCCSRASCSAQSIDSEYILRAKHFITYCEDKELYPQQVQVCTGDIYRV